LPNGVLHPRHSFSGTPFTKRHLQCVILPTFNAPISFPPHLFHFAPCSDSLSEGLQSAFKACRKGQTDEANMRDGLNRKSSKESLARIRRQLPSCLSRSFMGHCDGKSTGQTRPAEVCGPRRTGSRDRPRGLAGNTRSVLRVADYPIAHHFDAVAVCRGAGKRRLAASSFNLLREQISKPRSLPPTCKRPGRHRNNSKSWWATRVARSRRDRHKDPRQSLPNGVARPNGGNES